jgi:hypothetical protein
LRRELRPLFGELPRRHRSCPATLRRDEIKMAGAEARPLNPEGFQEPEGS